MLSYQHLYHAGNLADVHKHMLLATVLDYMTRKDKPLSYIETHAGRGRYDLSDPAARKTSEAREGIERLLPKLDPRHPYVSAVLKARAQHGPQAYPGSPAIAAALLRQSDRIHLAEMHPGEFSALARTMTNDNVICHNIDGFVLAHSLCPPTPRRGLILIDPSYEIKTDYASVPAQIAKIAKAWNVGIICLWYPILRSGLHDPMLQHLQKNHPDALRHEVMFPPAKKEHGLIGSGMFVVNPPFLLAQAARMIEHIFLDLGR